MLNGQWNIYLSGNSGRYLFINSVSKSSLKSDIWRTSAPFSHYKWPRNTVFSSISLASHHTSLTWGHMFWWEWELYHWVWSLKMSSWTQIFHMNSWSFIVPPWTTHIPAGSLFHNQLTVWRQWCHLSWHPSMDLLLVIQNFSDFSMWWYDPRVWGCGAWNPGCVARNSWH